LWFAISQARERLSEKQYALESKTQQETELADQVEKLSESLREARVHKDDLEMQLGKLRTQSVQLEEKLAGKDEIKNLATTVQKMQAHYLELKDSADKSATSAQQAQTRQLEAEVQRLTAQLAEATATKGAEIKLADQVQTLLEGLRDSHVQTGAQANEVENLKAALSKTQIELREE
jgi:hypothetical protein